MIQKYNSSFNLNKFFQKIISKKQYSKKLKTKINLLTNTKEKNYKNLNFLLTNKNLFLQNVIVSYVIYISFTRGNTWLHIANSFGKLKLFCSAGNLFFIKNKKKTRIPVLKSIMYFLLKKSKFLFNKPVILHLNNVKFRKFWILKKFKTKFCIKGVKIFNSYVYNGCRKKKIRRKKSWRDGWVV